jgi:hypothetical protein
MLTNHVIAALNAGIEANDEDAARRLIAANDPVARWLARPRLERAMIDAALACDEAGMRVPPPAHVMRVAALSIAGEPSLDPGDAAAISRAHGELASRSRPRFPVLTTFASALVLAAIGALALSVFARPEPPSRTYVRPLPAPSADAFVHGGVPLTDRSRTSSSP